MDWLLNDSNILTTIIVLGQGHFLTAYFYSWKGGKIDKVFKQKFLVLLLSFMSLSFYFYIHNSLLNYYILFTFLLFVFHFSVDEIKLQSLSFLKAKTLLSLLVTLSFFSVFYTKLFNFDINIFFVILATQAVLLSIFIFMNFEVIQHKFGKFFGSFAFFLVSFVLPIYLTFIDSISLLMVAGFIIVLHYVRWYLFYYEKFKNISIKDTNFYLKVVFWINCLLFLLYAVHYINYENSSLKFIFSQSFFYGWTIIHILLSLKPNDFKINLYE